MIKLSLQNNIEKLTSLKAGETLYLSGTVYTARDAAHKRLFSLIESGKDLPINLKNAAIYYAGPCPAKKGKVMGSIGPTSSYRMDKFTPSLLDNGLKFIIGKGSRNQEVINSIKKNKAVYFSAIGGAGALYAHAVVKAELVAYPDLLSEAIYKLEIKDFPVILAIDSNGNSVYGK